MQQLPTEKPIHGSKHPPDETARATTTPVANYPPEGAPQDLWWQSIHQEQWDAGSKVSSRVENQ
jgi:hypothetical protein